MNGKSDKFLFLTDMSAAGRLLFEKESRVKNFKDQTPLIARGDPVGGAYLVERGALRVYFMSAEGREGTLYWVEPGQSCILALNSLFSRLAYPAWVESEGETQIRFVPGDAYRRLFATESAIQNFTFDALSTRLFELMALIEQTAARGLEERVAYFLTQRAKNGEILEMTQEQIARHLATSREVVSRMLRRLAARRLIKVSPGKILLRDPEKLRALFE